MNKKATFPLPDQDGFVRLSGYGQPLPQAVADAICSLGIESETIRSGAKAKLQSALKCFGLRLSVEQLGDILVKNNGLPTDEARAIATSTLQEMR